MPRQLIYFNDHDCQGASRKSLCLSLGLSAGQLELERISTLVSSWLSVILYTFLLLLFCLLLVAWQQPLCATGSCKIAGFNCQVELCDRRMSLLLSPAPSPIFSLVQRMQHTSLTSSNFNCMHITLAATVCMSACVCVFVCVRNGLLNLAKKKRKQQQSAKPRSPC